MDFFDYQDKARKNTTVLLVYFALAVGAIISTIYFIATLAFFTVTEEESGLLAFELLSPTRFVSIAGITLLIISLASLYKIAQLSRGGRAVAELLGGRPIDPNTNRLQERQVLNVVEEMAIAAGLPVPTVYLLADEPGINAFAAGFAPTDAVIGVTQGTVDLLNRDELQGVIAHEFSHIFNADMRLNMRLMGLLHGILVIALLGYYVMRFTSGERKGNALLFFGLGLMAVGYTGVFFGRLIQSAVSRQREYLADASAVQFTRNPEGLAGALKKIGGLVHTSKLKTPQAQEAGHFLFAQGFSGLSLGSTHPPLAERIRRIEPNFNGEFPEVILPTKMVRPHKQTKAPARPSPASSILLGGAGGAAPHILFPLLTAEVLAVIGTLSQGHIAYAKRLLNTLPKRVLDQAHDPPGARAVVLALLVEKDPAIREAQMDFVRGSRDALLEKETVEMVTLIESIAPEARLPLVDLVLPALRRLSDSQYEIFDKLVDQLVRADHHMNLFEYTLRQVLKRHLDPAFRQHRAPRVEHYNLSPLTKECSYVLAALAHAGHVDEPSATKAFNLGQNELPELALSMHPREKAGISEVSQSLESLNRVSPKLKRELMRACCVVVAHDGSITLVEGELLRAIADHLGLPLPPFLAGQQVAKENSQEIENQ